MWNNWFIIANFKRNELMGPDLWPIYYKVGDQTIRKIIETKITNSNGLNEREWWGTGYRIIDSYLEVNLSQFYCLIYGFNWIDFIGPVEFWKFHRSVKHFVYAVTFSKLIQKNLRILAIRIVSYCVQSWRFGNQLRSAANITISTTLTLMYYVVFFSAKWKIKYSWL